MVHIGLRSGRRQELKGPTEGNLLRRLSGLSIWRDKLAILFGIVSLLACAALALYVWLVLPSIPLFLPLHYDGAGNVDLIGPRVDLLKMPGIGLIVLGADAVLASYLHRRERAAALALLATSILVQGLLIVATLNIIRLAFGD
ncbi:MAG TPA: hypothetical protein VFZ25_11430 [Chloroflexota bacterium]|nr:hypothetical protein [Chloroflexota bacterium]